MTEDQRVPSNEFIVEEIRLNRAAIEKVNDKLSGKVGRGELFAYLATLGTVLGLVLGNGG